MPNKPQQEKSYLERLKFDPKLLTSWVAGYITNIRIVLLLVITIVLLGLVSYFNLPRRLNPEIKIPIITVVTVLPGASPEDVESLITIPLENELKGLTGLDTITSNSQNNASVIVMQFFSTVAQEKAKQDVESAVDGTTTLPEDAQTPRVSALDFEDQPIWTFAVRHETNDIPSLMRFADQLRIRLEDEAKIDRVTVSGFETQEIVIEANVEKVAQYGLNPLQLSGAVAAAVTSFPSGTLENGRNSFSLTVDPSVTSVADVRQLKITVNDTVVQLGDIADVYERSKPGAAQALFADETTQATRVVTFNVFKLQTAKINEAAQAAQKIVDETTAEYNNRFSVITVLNTAEMVSKQFTDLLGEFRTTILLVFAALLIFLGLRQALISALTVPLTFLAAFIFMSIFGMSINFLSLFAFLLALGLLIDDTIVVVSAMTTYYKTGKFTPTQTGLLVWKDTIIPIWSTTITTIWSFIPLLLTSGIIGEFIKPIPVVITVTMISSTAIAVLVTLPFMMVLLKAQVAHRVVVLARILGFLALSALVIGIAWGNPLLPIIGILFIVLTFVFLQVRVPLAAFLREKLKSIPASQTIAQKLGTYTSHGILDIEILAQKYHRLILRILASKSARRTVLITIVTYSLIGFMLVPLGLVKNEFFPKIEGEQVFMTLELPSGTALEVLDRQAKEILEDVRQTPGAEFVIAEIGRGFSGGFGGVGETGNTALFTLHLPKLDDQKISSIKIAENLRQKYGKYSHGTISVVEESGGPPAGADVQIKLLGDNLGQLTTYADHIVAHLKTQSGLINVDKSIKPGTSALVFVPDTQKLTQQHIDVTTLGLWLRSYASGFTLDNVNFGTNDTDKRDIVFRIGGEKPHVETVSSLVIPTQNGSVPLISLGNFISKANPTVITREEGKRTISVTAAVTPGFSVTEKNQELLKFVGDMQMEPGYTWATGGVNEENQKSVQSIFQAMLISAILILVTMVIQFRSYRQALIVLIVIPLAVSSVFYAFALTGTPLSFPAIIGVLSLFGIVVTNSMFIVDKINLNQKEGMPFNESIADAGASRLEPIILTKLCTVLGLLPITISNPLWRGLGGAIISGLLLASSIMLLFIPVVYYQWFNKSASR